MQVAPVECMLNELRIALKLSLELNYAHWVYSCKAERIGSLRGHDF